MLPVAFQTDPCHETSDLCVTSHVFTYRLVIRMIARHVLTEYKSIQIELFCVSLRKIPTIETFVSTA